MGLLWRERERKQVRHLLDGDDSLQTSGINERPEPGLLQRSPQMN
jgi:hypothetical protein